MDAIIVACYPWFMNGTTAKDFLVFGDAVRDRAERDHQPVVDVATDMGASPAVAAKAKWLAGAYSRATRAQLGNEVLGRLSPSHLEVAARAPEGMRVQLLLRAAQDKLGVRALKRLATAGYDSERRGSTMVISGRDDLTSSARAISAYMAFDDEQLDRLLAGPRGVAIKALAQAGAELAMRIYGSKITSVS
jgi:hypothetical protein